METSDSVTTNAHHNEELQEGEAWEKCISRILAYDKCKFEGWIEDTDNLIIFATLFCSILTAFNIESYKLLQEDPTQSMVQLLTQILLQLSDTTTNNVDFAGSAYSAPSTATQQFYPSPASVRINVYWFFSLTSSLAYVSMTIHVRQWLREYMDWKLDLTRDGVRLRQYRHATLSKWMVFHIMGFLPLLLHFSVILFLVGLVEFTWTLNPTVAKVVSACAAFPVSFTLLTALLPVLWARCPYRTPHAWFIYNIIQRTRHTTSCVFHFLSYSPQYWHAVCSVIEHYWQISTGNLSLRWQSPTHHRNADPRQSDLSLYHRHAIAPFGAVVRGLRRQVSTPCARLLHQCRLILSISLLHIRTVWAACSQHIQRPPSYRNTIGSSWHEAESLNIYLQLDHMDRDILVWADETFGDVDPTFLTEVVRPCIKAMGSQPDAYSGMHQMLDNRIVGNQRSAPDIFRVIVELLEPCYKDVRPEQLGPILRDLHRLTTVFQGRDICIGPEYGKILRLLAYRPEVTPSPEVLHTSTRAAITYYRGLYIPRVAFAILWNLYSSHFTLSSPEDVMDIIAYATWACRSGHADSDCRAACALSLRLANKAESSSGVEGMLEEMLAALEKYLDARVALEPKNQPTLLRSVRRSLSPTRSVIVFFDILQAVDKIIEESSQLTPEASNRSPHEASSPKWLQCLMQQRLKMPQTLEGLFLNLFSVFIVPNSVPDDKPISLLCEQLRVLARGDRRRLVKSDLVRALGEIVMKIGQLQKLGQTWNRWIDVVQLLMSELGVAFDPYAPRWQDQALQQIA